MSVFRNESDEKEIILVCDCGLPEHQIHIYSYKDPEFIALCPALVTSNGFFRRLVEGLKYAFGYKSKYGQFDEILLRRDDTVELIEYLKGFLNDSKK